MLCDAPVARRRARIVAAMPAGRTTDEEGVTTPLAGLASDDPAPARRTFASRGARRRADPARVISRVICSIGAVAPMLHALVRGLRSDWVAASDNAMIAIRALDVLTGENHPLAGTASSVSATADGDLMHPGPILLDLLALPVRLLGADVGIPLTMAVLNAFFALWVVRLAGRCAGTGAQVMVTVVVNAVAWTMGWSRLLDPYNPHATLIPCVLLLVACWAITLDVRPGLLAAAVAASFCVQVHVGYVYIVPLSVLFAIAGRWLNVRRDRVRRRTWSGRHLATPVVATVVMWSQPLFDVLANGRESNPLRLLSAGGDESTKLGLATGARIAASIIVVPPAWTRSSFSRLGVIHSSVGVAVAAVAIAAAVAILTLLARLVRDHLALSSLLVLGAALVPAAAVAVALVPFLDGFAYAPHEFRWLWSLGALITGAVAWALCHLSRRTAVAQFARRRPLPVVVLAVTAAVALNVTNLGAIDEPGLQPRHPEELRATVDSLPIDRLRACDGIAVRVAMAFPSVEFGTVLLALRSHDIGFAMADEPRRHEFDRWPDGRERCLLTIADDVVDAPPAADLVARGGGIAVFLTPIAPADAV